RKTEKTRHAHWGRRAGGGGRRLFVAEYTGGTRPPPPPPPRAQAAPRAAPTPRPASSAGRSATGGGSGRAPIRKGIPPWAGARIDVEQCVALAVAAHRVLEERRRQAPAEPGKRELPPMCVSAQRERHAALGEVRPERGIVREGDDRRPRRHE